MGCYNNLRECKKWTGNRFMLHNIKPGGGMF